MFIWEKKYCYVCCACDRHFNPQQCVQERNDTQVDRTTDKEALIYVPVQGEKCKGQKKMIPQMWCRLTGVMVILCTIIFIVYEAEFDVKLREFQKPMAFTIFHKPMALNVSEEETENVTLSGCRCSMKPWPAIDKIISALNISVPWLNHTIVRQNLDQRHPNLPFELLTGAENKRCSLLPTIFSIAWVNRHWQQATLDADKFFLYSAFFDPERDGKFSIRLLGVSRNKSPGVTWCQIWYSSEAAPLPVKVTKMDYLDYQSRSSDRQMPYLLRCPLPPDIKDMPLAVSLTSKPCGQATNLLKVIGGKEREVSAYMNGKVPDNPTTLVKGWAAAVCGPALFYYHEDFSLRLVEWLELLRAQGFSRVFLYATDVHPNITKVLRHYTHEGFVQVTDYTYPPPYVNEPDLRRLWVLVERPKMFAQENVYFTDCVLRHMHQYRFLIHLDPDEVTILPRHDNFTHLLDEIIAGIKGSPPPGYRFQWSFFFNNLGPKDENVDLPTYLWALRHTGRQAPQFPRPTSGQFKSLYDMNAVRGVFSHGSLLCLSGSCNLSKMKTLRPEIAFLGHFKGTCDDKCKNSFVHDMALHKYKEQVGARVLNVLKTLQLL